MNKSTRIKEYVINELRPLVQADGGELMFVKLANHSLYLQLEGDCVNCPSNCRLTDWLLKRVQHQFTDIKELIITKKKRYFE